MEQASSKVRAGLATPFLITGEAAAAGIAWRSNPLLCDEEFFTAKPPRAPSFKT
jgi:hypothetical protein